MTKQRPVGTQSWVIMTELKTTVLGGRGEERKNPELWQPTTLNKVTAQYGAAW